MRVTFGQEPQQRQRHEYGMSKVDEDRERLYEEVVTLRKPSEKREGFMVAATFEDVPAILGEFAADTFVTMDDPEQLLQERADGRS